MVDPQHVDVVAVAVGNPAAVDDHRRRRHPTPQPVPGAVPIAGFRPAVGQSLTFDAGGMAVLPNATLLGRAEPPQLLGDGFLVAAFVALTPRCPRREQVEHRNQDEQPAENQRQ